MTAVVKIKRCPFCGSKPEFPDADGVLGTLYEAGCNNCCIANISIQIIDCFEGHERKSAQISWDNSSMRYGKRYIESAKSAAIEMWNKRA